uniref:Transmembrane protein n=1 Tax=Heterorhabditis bacteriophora TaxID=37862 RepID=A0A1I7WC68_HETBA
MAAAQTSSEYCGINVVVNKESLKAKTAEFNRANVNLTVPGINFNVNTLCFSVFASIWSITFGILFIFLGWWFLSFLWVICIVGVTMSLILMAAGSFITTGRSANLEGMPTAWQDITWILLSFLFRLLDITIEAIASLCAYKLSKA